MPTSKLVIIVTGASGFLGRTIIDRFVQGGTTPLGSAWLC